MKHKEQRAAEQRHLASLWSDYFFAFWTFLLVFPLIQSKNKDFVFPVNLKAVTQSHFTAMSNQCFKMFSQTYDEMNNALKMKEILQSSK